MDILKYRCIYIFHAWSIWDSIYTPGSKRQQASPWKFRNKARCNQLSWSLRIQICPKKVISPVILFWGWDWNHQSHSREGSGFLGYMIFSVAFAMSNFQFKCILVDLDFTSERFLAMNLAQIKVPETNSSPLKMGRNPKGKNRLPIHQFSGASC